MLGQLIKARREAEGLTQYGLAQKLGVSPMMVSAYELFKIGRRYYLPKVEALPLLCDILKIDLVEAKYRWMLDKAVASFDEQFVEELFRRAKVERPRRG